MTNASVLVGQTIQWCSSIEEAKTLAVAQSKPILLHFSSEDCGPCRNVEQFVYREPRVIQAVNDQFIAVKIDTKKQPKLTEQYQVNRIPHDVVLTSDGQVAFRRASPSSASAYVEMLKMGGNFAAQTSPRSQQVVEAMSGLTRQQADDRNRSPFYGEQAAAAGTVGAWPNVNQGVSNFNGTLPPANVRPSASAAPTEFGNGSQTNQQAPSHELTENSFPAAKFESRSSLPAVASPFAGNAPTAGTLPAVRSGAPLPAAGQLPLPRNLEASGQLPTVGHGAPSDRTTNAFYQEPEAGGALVANRRVPTTIPNDHLVQQVTANVKPENAPVGLESFCPVTLLSGQKWVKGDPTLGCYHRGVLYMFADQAALDRFMTAPDQWSPLLGGFDPVIMERDSRLEPGKRRFGVFCETIPGQPSIVLFANEANRDRFKEDSERYLGLIREVTAKADRN